MRSLLSDLTTFPEWGWGLGKVWKRNFKYFRYTIWTTLFWIVFEPVVYLIAIGKGLGYFIGDIRGQSYLEFFFPALLCMTGMMISFLEAAYASFTRMVHQKTFDTYLLTPIKPDEVALGEILWASAKGFLGVLGVVVVSSLMGLVQTFWLLPVLVLVFVLCWVSAAFGLLITSSVRHWDYFIYAQSGLIIPMTLFSGTYFPLEELPHVVARLAYLLPLSHAVQGSRYLMAGDLNPEILLNVGVLIFLGIFLTNWSVQRIKGKIYA